MDINTTRRRANKPHRCGQLRIDRELKETRELAQTTLTNGISGHLMKPHVVGLTGNYQAVPVDLDGNTFGID